MEMLKVHFLNVGHGDCNIIKHPDDRLTVIDINNGAELDLESSEELAKSFRLPIYTALERLRRNRPFYINTLGVVKARQSITAYERQTLDELLRKGYNIKLTNPIEFLHTQYPSLYIHRYIQTHPDLDHMRGLTALRGAEIEMVNFWDTEHEKTPEFQSDSDKEEWEEYQKLRTSKENPKVLRLNRGSTGPYYNQDESGTEGGDGTDILSPTPDIVKAANENDKTNNLSYVLRLRYKGITVIFGGDAEEEVWEDLVQQYGEQLKCDILKASHHGRDSGYYQEAVEYMNPQYTIVSVGQKPETDASNKYRQYSDNVWSTRWKGNITLSIDDDGKATINSEYNR
jgi:competence protein ComEC